MENISGSYLWQESAGALPGILGLSTGKMICMDLDGTLLRSDHQLNPEDLSALEAIGAAGWTRVIATGRSMDSFRRVFNEPTSLPIDFIVFSSGAGILETRTGRILRTVNLTPKALQLILAVLNDINLDYMIHYPAPLNTPFYWWSSGRHNPDFFRRISLYEKVSYQLAEQPANWKIPSAQIIAVQPAKDDPHTHIRLIKSLQNFTVIRTTSPLDKTSTWYEVFPGIVSKGKTCQWLSQLSENAISQTVAIGNDYNDTDMLEWADMSYVVSDAPEELKQRFHVIPDDNTNPVAAVIKNLIFFDR